MGTVEKPKRISPYTFTDFDVAVEYNLGGTTLPVEQGLADTSLGVGGHFNVGKYFEAYALAGAGAEIDTTRGIAGLAPSVDNSQTGVADDLKLYDRDPATPYAFIKLKAGLTPGTVVGYYQDIKIATVYGLLAHEQAFYPNPSYFRFWDAARLRAGIGMDIFNIKDKFVLSGQVAWIANYNTFFEDLGQAQPFVQAAFTIFPGNMTPKGDDQTYIEQPNQIMADAYRDVARKVAQQQAEQVKKELESGERSLNDPLPSIAVPQPTFDESVEILQSGNSDRSSNASDNEPEDHRVKHTADPKELKDETKPESDEDADLTPLPEDDFDLDE